MKMFLMKLDWIVKHKNVPKLEKNKILREHNGYFFPALIAANPNPNNAKNDTRYTCI